MDLGLRYVPQEADKWTVTRAIANVLHSEEFWPRKADERLINFQVTLKESPAGGVRNDGTGTLTLPTTRVGTKFLAWIVDHPIRINKKKVKFYKNSRPPLDYVCRTLDKTPYISPDIEEEHSNKLWDLQDKLRVEVVQTGVFYRSSYPTTGKLPPRSFSVEWEKQVTGWLAFEYDHKLIRITLGDSTTENDGSTIAISFANIQRMAVGYDGPPYICFDLFMPPVLEEIEFHRAHTGDKIVDNRRWRVSSLHPAHREVAPYAQHLRLLLFPSNVDPITKFVSMCRTADLTSKYLIVQMDYPNQIDATKQRFFDRQRVYRLRKQFTAFPFHVAFQLETLLHNHLLNTAELESLVPTIEKLMRLHAEQDGVYTGSLLRYFCEALKDPKRPLNESPMQCFNNVKKKVKLMRSRKSSKEHFSCYHITITPTRMLLEGPYATDSNRIVRLYRGYEHEFLRVDFSDEDRGHYKWEREVDTFSVIKERVEMMLKEGFDLAGRHFEFLAYSSSALREHAVWFMHPFLHTTEQGTVEVTADYIRRSQGDFEGTELLKQPSKFAARIAQAFTATVPSVEIRREEWEEVEDLGSDPYLFTDGVGTISKALGDRIWVELCKGRDSRIRIQPSAYQIRFLGFKGVVAVDPHLDENPNGILMRLRPSMKKFSKNSKTAILEIAEAFDYPKPCFLNKPLVMFLEDLGVRKETFMELKNDAEAEAKTINDSLSHFCRSLEAHGHGNIYKLISLLKRFEEGGLELRTNRVGPGIDTPFLHEIRQVAMLSVLRDIKFHARIAIPQSYMLVGVADEGPAYQKAGYKNVYSLPEGHIYACIQRPEDPEPTWISGSCSIFRNPITHPGDVQRVRAIGKPPDGMLCLFAHMKNVVVLPSVGSRSLASCLAGGDLDGDQFAVVNYPPLLPTSHENPASYAPNPDKPTTWTLDKDATIYDVCDFIVQYIHSDVLGLLSNRLLVIADQSKDGVRDDDCLYISELCSQAVDYPKQGIPVDLDEVILPRPLIRCKPDWQAAEVVSPRKTDYYESTRVLGLLYRSISLEEKPAVSSDFAAESHVLGDPISLAYKDRVAFYIGTSIAPAGESPELTNLFLQYADELNYICSIHTVTNDPGARLREAEVVVGTILAPCTSRRTRSDRMYRMRTHAMTLADDVRQQLFDHPSEILPTREDLVSGLERSWRAWELSLNRRAEFGANSFGLIALDSIFRLVDSLADYEDTNITAS